jgi:hypothetical protein
MSRTKMSIDVFPATLSGSFLIFWMQMKLEWHYLVFCTSGAAVGTVVGMISLCLRHDTRHNNNQHNDNHYNKI